MTFANPAPGHLLAWLADLNDQLAPIDTKSPVVHQLPEDERAELEGLLRARIDAFGALRSEVQQLCGLTGVSREGSDAVTEEAERHELLDLSQ